MKFSGRTQMLSGTLAESTLVLAKELGFDGVEICLFNRDWSFVTLDQQSVLELCKKTADLGLFGNSLSHHGDYLYDDKIFERIQNFLPCAAVLDNPVFIISGCVKDINRADEWQQVVQRTKKLANLARSCGVKLALEFEPGFVIGTTSELCRLIDDVASPSLAANLDLGHAFICDPDMFESIRDLGPRIAHCHIEDMKRGIHDHKLPGEGDMDLPAVFRALEKSGFDGSLSLDLYSYDYAKVARDALKVLRPYGLFF